MGRRYKKLKEQLRDAKEDARKHSLMITALYLWLLLAVYEIHLRTYDLYRTLPEVDLLGHFLGGIALAATFIWIAQKLNRKHYAWFAMIGTLVASLVWEAGEKIQELIFYNPPYLIDVFFFDGVIDIILALVGAATFLLIKLFKK